MHHSQFTEKDKQIEYINQYYDQLRQEKLTNKKIVEEDIRRQNFDCDQIQNIKPTSASLQREVQLPQSRIAPTSHHQPDPYAIPTYTQYEPKIPIYSPVSQTIKYQDPPSHYQEFDGRYFECSGIPQNYHEKPPTQHQHEIRPHFNQFQGGDHRYVYNAQPSAVQGHYGSGQYAPPRPPMYCGDQNTANISRDFVEKAPCTCQCKTKIPVRIIPTIKNRTDELQTQDLRNQWLSTYNNARMERKNNIKKNR